MAIPSTVTYKGNSKYKSQKLSLKQVVNLKREHPDDLRLRNLFCPTPGCMAKLVAVIGKHSYLRSAPNNNHDNDHVNYCPYRVDVTHTRIRGPKVPVSVTEQQISQSDDYFLRKLGPGHTKKSQDHGKNRGTKGKSNHQSQGTKGQNTGHTVIKGKGNGSKSNQHPRISHLRPDTLGPTITGKLIIGGFLKGMKVKNASIILTIEYNKISKDVITTLNFNKHHVSTVNEAKAIEKSKAINAYLKKHKLLFDSFVSVKIQNGRQIVYLDGYYDDKFNIYGSRWKWTIGQFFFHVIEFNNKL